MPDLFLPRSRPWHLTTAAEGGLKSAPASRLRGAVPHQLSSYASSSLARFVCSWRTMTGKPEIMPDCGTNFRLADKPPTTCKLDLRHHGNFPILCENPTL